VTRRGQRRRAIASLAAGVVALAAAGCGTSERHANRNRPPLPINLAVYVSGSSVSVSPAKLGAGPVVLVATNQTDQPHSLTLVEDRDGAIWLRTTDFGDDKDRVLVKADGETTYFASDAAYYLS